MNPATGYHPSHHHGGHMDNHHAYLSNGHAPASMPQYTPYQPPPPMHHAAVGYHNQPQHYGYAHPVAATHYPPPPPQYPHHHALTLPAMPSNQSSQHGPTPQYHDSRPMDNTGQVAPPGHKPKLTGTVWEDEGTICFQVEVNGICVARREDNCFINGTKLLNVANMTRGRRDGILKSEKNRSVIKIGPMHLKGVWIPFERALEFANKEKITEQLYPLFVHNIGPLLTPHMQSNLGVPRGAGRDATGQPQTAGASSQRASASQPPLTQSHSVGTAVGTASSQPQTTSSSASAVGRPGLDRAHTFPTPPTSASSVMGLGTSAGSYEWPSSTVQQSSTLGIESNPNSRSMPTTPTTTPPDSTLHNMQYQPYDHSRHVYSTPSQQSNSQYSSGTYHHAMPPPVRVSDLKEEDTTEREYAPAQVPYADHGYSYNAATNETQSLKTSPKHSVSGHATPRSLESPAAPWQGYATPQRAQTMPQSNLAYGTPASNTPQYSYTNTSVSQKRGRDDDDDDPYARPNSQAGSHPMNMKRQKTAREDSHPLNLPPRTAIVQRQ